MNNHLEKIIVEAPNYLIRKDGVVINNITKLPISESVGSVRLTVDGKRKSFKVSELVKQYFTEEEVVEEKAAEEVKEEPTKKVKEPKADKKPKKEKPAKSPKQAKEKKSVNNGGKKDKSFFDKVRADYDKDPENFDIMKYSKKVEVSYGRIWSVIKLHKEKLEKKATDKKSKK